MAEKSTSLSLCFLTILSLVLNRAALVNSDGLKIRLIHPDSPESPFSQNNLSGKERIEKLVSQSNSRADHLSKRALSCSFIGAPMEVQAFNYIVKIGIGTFNSKPPYKEYFLEMDTGSSPIWMQCEGCTRCFDQTPKPFPCKNSSSFHPFPNKINPEPYEYKYADGCRTKGILARETFYLRSKSGKVAKVPNVKFGCGLENNVRYVNPYGNNKIAGVMGLGWHDSSFVNQLSPKTKGKFSYCLPLLSVNSSNTYLRFGDDHRCCLRTSRKTPLYRTNWTSAYFVDLQGISVNKAKLNITPNAFAHNASSPGCVIDTGTPFSRIKTPAFDVLKQELDKYISRLKGLKRITGGIGGLELCYERGKTEQGFDRLPEVTFHLRGSKADFVMRPEAVFKIFGGDPAGERLCLAMMRDDRWCIIGSRQQANQRMSYDAKKNRLVFGQQDCAKPW